MSVVSRGVRNSFRNSIRTVSIVVILGLSIGLALVMVLARQAVEDKINSVKGSIGNIVTISPAGARGFEGGGEPLTGTALANVKKLPHVVSLSETVNDRLDSTQTNLQSAIAAGSLGRRGARQFGGGGNFSPPIIVVGTTDPTSLQSFGGGKVSLTSGQLFDATKDSASAVIGSGLAAKNNLSVGSTFTAYDTQISITGIFDSSNRFGNSVVVMPLSTVQRLSGQSDDVSTAVAQIDSIENMDSTLSAIKNKLGDSADVVSQQDTSAQALAPLQNIKSVTVFSLIGSVLAGAIIILLTMLMIVRERRREIGVLKAIGASNSSVSLQFIIEALTFSIMGMVVGLGLGVLAANPVTKLLITSNTAQPTSSGEGGFGASGIGRGGGVTRFFNRNLNLNSIHAVVSWHIIVYGILATIVIAIIGSAVPAWLIAKVRPSEVLRSE